MNSATNFSFNNYFYQYYFKVIIKFMKKHAFDFWTYPSYLKTRHYSVPYEKQYSTFIGVVYRSVRL